ncbi:glycosyltransferase [Croceimicrobium sp.]|uniref:glycosyltransferase n=1 Tax=Croceimicrobium sp. TaxID=2828340 RepID=UPI003BABD8F3
MKLLLNVLSYSWLLAALVLWLWHGRRYYRLRKIIKQKVTIPLDPDLAPLSLIICFRNEAVNLKRLLSEWCEQDYPDYEVIMVDDHSTDNGAALVQEAQERYPFLKLVNASDGGASGKKAALQRGIIAAQNDALAFCDADCKPASKHWLKEIGLRLKKNDVVLGYGPLQGEGFTAWLSDYETVNTALRYWSYASMGKAYMGVGRNLAYRKSSMQAVQALNKHQDLLSGDDDLTLREMADGLKVVCMSPQRSFTYSPAPANLKQWWRQKGRHYSTAWRYEKGVRFSLALEGFLQLLFALLLPIAFWHLNTTLVLAVFIGRWLFSAYPGKIHRDLIQHKAQAWLWPFFEMFWAIATTLLHLRNLIWGAPSKW